MRFLICCSNLRRSKREERYYAKEEVPKYSWQDFSKKFCLSDHYFNFLDFLILQ